MEYQVSWGTGGDTLIMPKQQDVIRGHIKRYLTASSKEHVAIVDETLKALEILYANIDDNEEENFTDILSNIVSDILQDEQIAIDFYKKDSVAWADYLGKDESLHEILEDYAKATTLYEVHVGSDDYDRLRGQSGYKFGRDMQKLPKFDLDAFKREYGLKPRLKASPLQLEVSVTKKGATSTRGSFEEVMEQAKKERRKQRRKLLEKYKGKKAEFLRKEYNKLRAWKNRITEEDLTLMEERYEKGVLKRNADKQMLRILIDHLSAFTNSAMANLVDKSLSVNYRLISEEASEMYYQVGGGMSGALQSMSDLAQAQIDEKSKQIKSRGVISGGWTSVAGQTIKFNKNMFETDEDDEEEEEEFKGNINLMAYTLNNVPKNITEFTLSDLIDDAFLRNPKRENYTVYFDLDTTELIKQIEKSGQLKRFLDYNLAEISKVSVNMIEIKFVLPKKEKKGTTSIYGAFSQEQQILAKRLAGIKVITNLKSAHVAEWDTGVYDTGAKASRKMQEHLSLFKERVEELVDFYDVEVTGQVDDMED